MCSLKLVLPWYHVNLETIRGISGYLPTSRAHGGFLPPNWAMLWSSSSMFWKNTSNEFKILHVIVFSLLQKYSLMALRTFALIMECFKSHLPFHKRHIWMFQVKEMSKHQHTANTVVSRYYDVSIWYIEMLLFMIPDQYPPTITKQ